MNSQNENELSEVKKRILAREKVQQEMDDLRAKIKELREQEKIGKNVHQDIEAYLDYLKVLKKEKDSIREGNHTAFLDAKKIIAPKLNYGSKKEEVLSKIKEFAKEIRTTEKALAGGGLDSSQRAEIDLLLKETKVKHQEALMELKSIEQFNHTRFLEQKELNETNNLQEENVGASTQESNLENTSTKDLKITPPPVRESSENSEFNPPPMI